MSLRHPKERPSPGLTRRDFLKKSAATAAAVPAASALLAACGKPPSATSGEELILSTKTNPTPMPTFPDNPPIESRLTIEEGATLKIYNWDQYIYMKVVKNFEQKYGVKVEISTFNNGDEALAKMRSGGVDYDVFFPTIDMLGKLTQAQLLQPLNHDYLTNMKNLWPFYSEPNSPFYDIGQVYSVPYTVYSTGIAWRNDLVDPKDDPWHISNPYDIIWNPKYKGKIGIYDDCREATGMVLLRNGVTDVNTSNVADLNAATDSLLELVDKVNVALTVNGVYEDLPKGIFDVHQAWSGDLLAAPYYGKENASQTAPLLSYWWPKDEKGVIGNDLMSIPKASKNPVLAHTFINYLLDFDVSMLNMSWNGYQPPQNDAPPEAFTDPNFKWQWNVVPTPNNTLLPAIVQFKDLEVGYWLWELNPDVNAIWLDNWEQIQAG